MASQSRSIGDYLAAHGGPFYELQLRLGMLREDALRAGRRAVVFVALAFGVPLILSILQGHAWAPFAERPFLLDPAVWARYVIAIGLFTIVERQVEIRSRDLLRQLVAAPILSPSSFEAGAAAVGVALRRRDSRLAEAICLVLAAAASIVTLSNALNAPATSWAVQGPEGAKSLTLAAWWCIVVSNPLFWFLFLRSLWRHFVWSMLLRDLARLEFRLVVTHPDGNGGLGFIGRYPNSYSMLVLGIGCVVGAAVARQLLDDDLAITTYGYIMAGWLLVVLAFFAFPLTAFAKPLGVLKQNTLRVCGAQATRFHRRTERKVLGANIAAPDPAEGEGESEIGDPSKEYDTARKLSIYLVSRTSLVPVAAAALLPLAAAGLTEFPYKELLSVVKKLLLL